jgi:hypothetical protein
MQVTDLIFKAPPDDSLRKAIPWARKVLDCFVASAFAR